MVVTSDSSGMSPASGRALLERVRRLREQLDETQIEPMPQLPLPESLDMSIVLGWTAIELQRLAGANVSYFSAHAMDAPDSNEIMVTCCHPRTAKLAYLLLQGQALVSGDVPQLEAIAALVTAVAERRIPNSRAFDQWGMAADSYEGRDGSATVTSTAFSEESSTLLAVFPSIAARAASSPFAGATRKRRVVGRRCRSFMDANIWIFEKAGSLFDHWEGR